MGLLPSASYFSTPFLYVRNPPSGISVALAPKRSWLPGLDPVDRITGYSAFIRYCENTPCRSHLIVVTWLMNGNSGSVRNTPLEKKPKLMPPIRTVYELRPLREKSSSVGQLK